MRLAKGFGIALIPTALIITMLTVFLGPTPMVTGIFVGGAAALLLEPWDAIRGGFGASVIGGLQVYGTQALGGSLAGLLVWYVLAAIF